MRAASAGALALGLLSASAAAQTPPPPPGLVPVYPPGVTPDSPRPAPAPPAKQAPGAGPVAPGSVAYPPPGVAVPSLGAPSAAPPPYGGYSYYAPAPSEALPLTLPYQEGDTLPRGYRIESHAVRSFVVSGAVTFGTSWLASLLAAGVAVSHNDTNRFAPLFAPVVGPFVAVGTTASTGAGTVWLVLDGLAQTGGVVLFAYGLAAEEKVLKRESSDEARLLHVLAHPQVGIGGRGLTLRWTM